MATPALLPLADPGMGNGTGSADYDPLAHARDSKARTVNWEATVPAACYTKTEGLSNPCWVCHTVGREPNYLVDFHLQTAYAFSDVALTNHWDHLFEDRSEEEAAISDDEIRAWLDGDNYTLLKEALQDVPADEYPGYRPDLDLAQGFDEFGFARDGSGWRALRYKPFPGTFWPTNGSIDDVFVRLPRAFRTRGGEFHAGVARANLSILEAAIAADPRVQDDDALVRQIEPLDETDVAIDLDRDGRAEGVVQVMRGLPRTFVGDASNVRVERYVHPAGVEYLHSVRYVDPSSPTGHSTRMKELRWSRKDRVLDHAAHLAAYHAEDDDKDKGLLPVFEGRPNIGLSNDFGWRLAGFIEDGEGRLRLQTDEEQRFCMGCHSAIGVTVDQTFTLARKVPGAQGWAYQDLAGMKDVPQAGHAQPEVLTYFERVRGGDEFRANREIHDRFFDADGEVRRAEVLRAAPGGDLDLRHLVMPGERRALDLARAYRVLVARQRWDLGRDVVLGGAATRVFPKIDNGDTELGKSGLVFMDGSVWLNW
ncbi:hypothetical protein [Saltatorellus ferox]